MQMSSGSSQAIDVSRVVTRVKSVAEARALPAGTVVGDHHGGVTFTDAIARELEKRSHGGWRDVVAGTSDARETRWTVIVLNR